MSDSKVEVIVGGNSVEVDPSHYRVALGILTIGLPLLGIEATDGEDFISMVFPDSDSVEYFSSFLLAHKLFPDDSGGFEVNGSFRFDSVDGDLCTSYLVHVDLVRFDELEACLAAHTPVSAGASN
jgi:hypothetical protein